MDLGLSRPRAGDVRHRLRTSMRRAWLRRKSIGRLNNLLLRAGDPRDVLEAGGASIGPSGRHYGPVLIHNADDYRNLTIGHHVHLGMGVRLDLTAPIVIEADATVSMGVTILTHADVGRRPLRAAYPRKVAATVIREGAWVGANATILAGCHVGRMAVVGAGAVVTRPVPDGAVVTGVPAAEASLSASGSTATRSAWPR
jgi:acetyltransferase-like isoleucine patch superfamily enzyme